MELLKDEADLPRAVLRSALAGESEEVFAGDFHWNGTFGGDAQPVEPGLLDCRCAGAARDGVVRRAALSGALRSPI